MSSIKPPTFDWEPQNFKKFRRYCELLLSTPAYSELSDSHVVNYILLWMGPRAVDIFDNWTFTEAQKSDPAAVWQAFEDYFEPKSNFRLARFQLRDMIQHKDESIDAFLIRLRCQAHKCNFVSDVAIDDNILDQIIKGVLHDPVRKKKLDYDPKKLTLDKAVDFARIYESTPQHT
jgi:hypothetical protein